MMIYHRASISDGSVIWWCDSVVYRTDSIEHIKQASRTNIVSREPMFFPIPLHKSVAVLSTFISTEGADQVPRNP